MENQQHAEQPVQRKAEAKRHSLLVPGEAGYSFLEDRGNILSSSEGHMHTRLGRKPVFMGKLVARFLMAVAPSGFLIQSRLFHVTLGKTRSPPRAVGPTPPSVLLIMRAVCNNVMLHSYAA